MYIVPFEAAVVKSQERDVRSGMQGLGTSPAMGASSAAAIRNDRTNYASSIFSPATSSPAAAWPSPYSIRVLSA